MLAAIMKSIANQRTEETEEEKKIKVLQIKPLEHVAAYLEKRELDRNVEPMECDSGLLERVTSNYVIVKKILANLSWQDKLVCKHVCTMWHSLMHTLAREQMSPTDFAINLNISALLNGITLKKSGNFYTEPLAVLAFTNIQAFNLSNNCSLLVPSPCNPPCRKQHCFLDMVHHNIGFPKNCMVVAKSTHLSYFPTRQSKTFEGRITQKMFRRLCPFLLGVHIPMIPNVQFDIINVNVDRDMQASYFRTIDKIAETRTFKALLVYVTDNFLWNSVEDIIFLNYFRDVQNHTPFAMAGCIVGDTVCDQNDIKQIVESVNQDSEFVSENLVSIACFSIPKNVNPEDICNFDSFSLIINSTEWSKQKIQQATAEFAQKVPRFEHSVAFKLSCIGRDQKHDYEQECFAAYFPHTRIVGLYGNGELGLNHPARAPPEDSAQAKRHKTDPDAGPVPNTFDIMFSYSTVYLYMGWGKVSQPAATTT